MEPDAPLFYVAAGGFTEDFMDAVEAGDHPATCWALDDLYAT